VSTNATAVQLLADAVRRALENAPEENWGWETVLVGYFEREERERFCDAVLADHTLRELARDALRNPASVELFNERNERLTSSRILGITLLAEAARWLWIQLVASGDEVTDEAIERYARKTLDAFAQSVLGGSIEAIVFTACAGLKVMPDRRIELPFGCLRGPLHEHLFNMGDPMDSGADETSIVLLQPLQIRCRLLDGDHLEPPDPPRRHSDLPLMLTRLAVLLSAGRLLMPTWETILLPFQGSRMTSIHAATLIDQGTLGETPLTISEADDLEVWATRVAESFDRRISVAIRRTLSAVAERDAEDDALIDAVIAWENLFGAGSGELSFRICGSLARILAPADQRAALFKDLVKVYDARSRLVHGVEADPEATRRMARTAVQTAVQALRVLFEEYPWIISSTEPAKELLLDLPRDGA
jgi:hypothetical protein